MKAEALILAQGCLAVASRGSEEPFSVIYVFSPTKMFHATSLRDELIFELIVGGRCSGGLLYLFMQTNVELVRVDSSIDPGSLLAVGYDDPAK